MSSDSELILYHNHHIILEQLMPDLAAIYPLYLVNTYLRSLSTRRKTKSINYLESKIDAYALQLGFEAKDFNSLVMGYFYTHFTMQEHLSAWLLEKVALRLFEVPWIGIVYENGKYYQCQLTKVEQSHLQDWALETTLTKLYVEHVITLSIRGLDLVKEEFLPLYTYQPFQYDRDKIPNLMNSCTAPSTGLCVFIMTAVLCLKHNMEPSEFKTFYTKIEQEKPFLESLFRATDAMKFDCALPKYPGLTAESLLIQALIEK